MTTAYVDSSAIVKLVLREAESTALVRALGRFDAVITSDLSEVEVARAARRAGVTPDAAADVLEPFARAAVDAEVVRLARTIDPPGLRALDALQLASAVSLAIDGLVFVGYDRRLLTATRAAGLVTAAPGA